MTNAERIISNLQELIENHKEHVHKHGEMTEDKPEYDWWYDSEHDSDLTKDIKCPWGGPMETLSRDSDPPPHPALGRGNRNPKEEYEERPRLIG